MSIIVMKIDHLYMYNASLFAVYDYIWVKFSCLTHFKPVVLILYNYIQIFLKIGTVYGGAINKHSACGTFLFCKEEAHIIIFRSVKLSNTNK